MTSTTPDTPHPTPPQFEALATTADLPPGALLRVVASDGTPLCLFNDRGTIGAVHDTCTHAEFSMSEGQLHADGTIECVWHGARFDCRSGAVRRPPAFDPLPVFEVKVDGDTIHVGPQRKSP